MSDRTSIEWTDASWNPLRAIIADSAKPPKTGWACVRVSQGCTNCYAATLNKRLGTGLDYTVPALKQVSTYLDENVLMQPHHWRKPRRVFVCSMTDLFGEWVTDEQISDVFEVMRTASQHTYQVLTKRPERLRAWMSTHYRDDGSMSPLPNVWLGVSVEDQAAADERIPHLLATPAAVRFLSCEPLLGPVDLTAYLPSAPMAEAIRIGAGTPDLHWVIVGGESGARARPMDLAWARSLVQQCVAAGVAVFVKQLGSRPVDTAAAEGICVCCAHPNGPSLPRGSHGDLCPMRSVRESHGRDMSEWPEDLRVREWPR